MSQLPPGFIAIRPDWNEIVSPDCAAVVGFGTICSVLIKSWAHFSTSTLIWSLNWNLVGSTIWSTNADPVAQDRVCNPHQVDITPSERPHCDTRLPSFLVSCVPASITWSQVQVSSGTARPASSNMPLL